MIPKPTSLRLAVPNLVVSIRPPSAKPITIVGNGRSGTSWIGETVGRAPGVAYYREPCNPTSTYQEDDTVWSRYVPPGGDDPHFRRCLDDAFSGKFLSHREWRKGEFRKRVAGGYRVVVKEVACFLSVEWLFERYHPDLVMVTRHPCPSAMSVHNLGLIELEKRRLREITENEELREGLLKPHLAHLEAMTSPLEVSAAIWAVKNLVAFEAKQRVGRDWIQVAYEDACLRPVETFQEIYRALGLEWTAENEAKLIESTSTAKPGPHATSKVSNRQVDGWKEKMGEDERRTVRRVIAPFELPLYEAEHWWVG